MVGLSLLKVNTGVKNNLVNGRLGDLPQVIEPL
jgi:hypothetical protein